MLRYLFITAVPEIAAFAVDCGVERIFLDLESHGKAERQGHLDTHMSFAGFDDIAPVRDAIGDRAELLVRLNPVHAGTSAEVERAILDGADSLMLPFFETARDVERFCGIVDDRVRVVPLVETAPAADALSEIVQVPGVGEIFVGLNDLHLSLGQDFLFQPLADGTVDRLASITREAGLPFGFGGIAKIGEGELDARLILGEHVRLGSSSVILSRAFHGRATSLAELTANIDFAAEIDALRSAEHSLTGRSPEAVRADRLRLVEKVAELVSQKVANRASSA